MKLIISTLTALSLNLFAQTATDVDQVDVDGNNNVTHICQPNVAVSCNPVTRWKTKIVEKEIKVVEVIEKEVKIVEVLEAPKNRISLTIGHGALGNLKESPSKIETEQGPVIGLQYMRDLESKKDSADDMSTHLLIQGQTNKTFSIGIGVGF